MGHNDLQIMYLYYHELTERVTQGCVNGIYAYNDQNWYICIQGSEVFSRDILTVKPTNKAIFLTDYQNV